MIKLKITKIDDLLNEDLTLEQRGILITCLLVRDKTDKLTYAKIKSEINLSKYKLPLLDLCDKKFITWSESDKQRKKLVEQDVIDPQVKQAVDFMNELYQRNFKATSSSTVSGLKARLKEFSLKEVKMVITNRYHEWKDDKTMSKYLTPYTLFRKSNFQKYLDDANNSGKGMNFITVSDIGIKPGDEITLEIGEKLSEKLSYPITEFKLSEGGEPLGIGTGKSLLGSDILSLLKRQQRKINNGEKPEFILIYNNR